MVEDFLDKTPAPFSSPFLRLTKLHAAGVSLNVVELIAGDASNTVLGQVYVHRDQLPLSLLAEGWRNCGTMTWCGG